MRQLCYGIWSLQARPSPSKARMSRGLPVCQQMHQRIIQNFENNFPHSLKKKKKISRILALVESGQISVPRPKTTSECIRDLCSLRCHFLKNRHVSIMDIVTWTWGYFSKPLSVSQHQSLPHPHMQYSAKQSRVNFPGPSLT